MTREEYERRKAETRAAPGWKPKGEPNCSDCCCMSHCETHHKIEGEYPDEWVTTNLTNEEK